MNKHHNRPMEWNVIQFPVKQKPKLASFDHTAAIGYVGLILVQLNVLPAIIEAIKTGSSAPVSSILMMVVGLSCYLYNSVKTRHTLYTVGNACGLFCNLVLLLTVILKGN